MKKVILVWKEAKQMNTDGLVGMSHGGCCNQNGGCAKKHG